jgi:hypothetical protein
MNIVRNIYQLAKQAITGFGTITELPLESGSYAVGKSAIGTFFDSRCRLMLDVCYQVEQFYLHQ